MTHPGGMLGKRLLVYIDDLYHKNQELPLVLENTSLQDTLQEMTEKRLGIVCITNSAGKLIGVYTDGDVRRTLLKGHHPETTLIREVMTTHYRTIKRGTLAAEALTMMQQHSITALIVVDNDFQPFAVLHIHDLLRAGIY